MRLLVPLAVAIAAFVLAPTLIVVPMSFSASRSFQFPPPSLWLGHYSQYFTDPRWLEPTFNSIIIAAAATVITMVIVTPAAFALARYAFFGRNAFNLLLMTPLMVPHIALALGFYTLFASLGLIGTHISLVLAHTSLNVPVSFLIVSATLKGFDRNLERAAASLGAGPFTAFFTVTMPVLRPGFYVAALFSFIHSFDETTVALFIAGRGSETLPRKLFESIELDADPVIAVVSTLLITLVIAGVVLPAVVRRRIATTHAR